MAVSYLGVSATATPAGTTTTAGTASVTPSLPVGTASGDRVFVLQASSNTSTAPTGWTQLYKDVQVGVVGTAPGAGLGRRYISCYYRDYDGAWTMPAFVLTSATQNSNAVSAMTVRKAAGDTWNAPTFSSPGHDTVSDTAWSVTIPSFATVSGALLMTHSGHTGGAASASAQTLTQSGATLANVTERYDNGTATGNDVRLVFGTADVTSGATATLTRTATLSAAATGGTAVVQQTVTPATPQGPEQTAYFYATVPTTGSNPYTNAANATADDGAYATSVVTGGAAAPTVFAAWDMPGVTLPSDATFVRAAFEYEYRFETGTTSTQTWVNIYDAAWGAIGTTTTHTVTPTVDTVMSSPMTGVTLGQLGTSTRGGLTVWKGAAPDTTVYVDYVRYAITYTQPAGSSPSAGTSSGGWTATGSASGRKPSGGSATAAWKSVGSAFGQTTRRGTSTGTWSVAGSASGGTPRAGTSTGAWSVAGSASGSKPKVGTSVGAWSVAGTASGSKPARGSTTTTWKAVGSASGQTTHRGTSTRTWAVSGSATGQAPALPPTTAPTPTVTPGSTTAQVSWSAVPGATSYDVLVIPVSDRAGVASGGWSVAGSARGQVARDAALAGSGVLSVATAPKVSVTAAVSSSGALSVATAPTVSVTAVLGGPGVLSVALSVAQTRSADLTGSGLLSPVLTSARSTASADLNGFGILVAGIQGQAQPVSAQRFGDGALTVVTQPAATIPLGLGGTGTLTVALSPSGTLSAALSGSGAQSLTVTPAAARSAALVGAGALTASFGAGTSSLGVSFAGSGQLTVAVFTGVALPPLTGPVTAVFKFDGVSTAVFVSDGVTAATFSSDGAATGTFSSDGVGAGYFA